MMTTRVQEMQAELGKSLNCSRSGSAETLVVMKSLLAERVMTELTRDPWSGRMTMLMVDQACLVQSLKGAAKVGTAQSNLRVKESLLSTSLLLICGSSQCLLLSS